MHEKVLSGLSNAQLMVLQSASEFEKDHPKIIDILLNRNGLSADIFAELHSDNNCQVSSEYVYSKGSGLVDPDFLVEEMVNMFVRKCQTHRVESREFGVLGSTPEDWDGISKSRRHNSSNKEESDS